MASIRTRLMCVMVPILAVLLFSPSSIDGQVTFSRDWKAGKRSAVLPTGECSTGLSTVSTLCHMLITELKTVASCEAMSLLDRRVDHAGPLHSLGQDGFPLPLAVNDKR